MKPRTIFVRTPADFSGCVDYSPSGRKGCFGCVVCVYQIKCYYSTISCALAEIMQHHKFINNKLYSYEYECVCVCWHCI